MFITTLLNKFLKKTAAIALQISGQLKPNDNNQSMDKQAIRCAPWFRDNGDKTLRLNYDLNQNSVVVDLGGYEGQWSSDLFSKYCSNIYIFEPYLEYASKIKDRFKNNSKIKVFDFGLSGKDEIIELNISDDGSSIFKPSTLKVKIELKEAVSFFINSGIETIDLLKINIEGGEYDFLDTILNSEYIKKIKDIQVQFHDFVPDAEARMKGIQDKLKITHSLTYQYEFVWENWRLKI